MINKALNIHAHEHLSIQVYIRQMNQSPQHSSKIVKAFERTNVQLYNDLSLQANKHISFQVCGYHTSEYQFL